MKNIQKNETDNPIKEYNIKELENFVLENLKQESAFKTIKILQDSYPETIFYLFGGAIRDILITYFHGTKSEIKDFDIFINDNKKNIQNDNFIPRVEELGFKHYLTPTGKPRCFRGKEYSLEFPLFSNNGFTKEKMQSEKDIVSNINDFFNNTGVFCFKNEKLTISKKALDSIRDKKIVLVDNSKINNNPNLIARIILQKLRLNFSLEAITINEIKKSFDKINFKDIEEYLYFKDYQKYVEIIRKELENISK